MAVKVAPEKIFAHWGKVSIWVASPSKIEVTKRAWREQSVRVKMVECEVEKWADGAIQVVYSRAQWRKRLCAGNRAPLLETISFLPVNTLLARSPSMWTAQLTCACQSLRCLPFFRFLFNVKIVKLTNYDLLSFCACPTCAPLAV